MNSYLAIYFSQQIIKGKITLEEFTGSSLAKNNPKLVSEVSALIEETNNE